MVYLGPFDLVRNKDRVAEMYVFAGTAPGSSCYVRSEFVTAEIRDGAHVVLDCLFVELIPRAYVCPRLVSYYCNERVP